MGKSASKSSKWNGGCIEKEATTFAIIWKTTSRRTF